MTTQNPITVLEDVPVKQRGQYKTTTILHCIGVSWGIFAYGYIASIIGTTIGQPTFYLAMGLTGHNTAAILGAANALFFFGGAVGSLVVAVFADKYGRRPFITIGTIVMLVSTALVAGSVHIAMFIVFRFTGAIGGYMVLTAVPLWITETVPPRGRGVLNDINPIFLNLGYLTASWTGVGIFFYKGPAAWRIPFAIACGPCLICLLCVWFVPESPRFLLLQGRSEEAWKIVSSLHTWHGDDTFARLEFEQMNQQINFDRSLKGGWREMARRPSYRKRCIMAVILVFTMMNSGILVITNYGTIIYSQLGYDNKQQLFLQAGYLTAATFANMSAVLFVDRISRPLLVTIGMGGCIVSLIAETALIAKYAASTNLAGLRAAVAFLYIYVFFFGAFLDGPTWWYTPEFFPMHLRAHGIAISTATYAITNIIWTASAPTAFANIGWKYYLFFIILSTIGTVYIWFTFPDTKNKPLEEVAALFGDNDIVVALQANGFTGTGQEKDVVQERETMPKPATIQSK
ncbi:MFS transporter [Exophiala viscosa]|uniref:MFS transporter n=1 Tax=Exophiala viscosa TaxID=2486360 RepID=A0AAN6DM13_9EURO|nr:MFS transporter [Exophiala viscosa]